MRENRKYEQSRWRFIVCRIAAFQDEIWTESRLLKLFQIAQLQLQYVLRSQNSLLRKLTLEKTRYTKTRKEHGRLKRALTRSPPVTRELFRVRSTATARAPLLLPLQKSLSRPARTFILVERLKEKPVGNKAKCQQKSRNRRYPHAKKFEDF